MLVSETGTENKMAPEQVSALWGAFDGLSEERKNILTAEEMPEIMGRLQESLALNDAVIGGISLLVRKIFFGEITLPELEWRVNDMLVKVGGDTRQVRAVVEYIQSEILTLKPKPRVEEKLEEEQKSHVSVQAVKLPLLQALSKYENLGNQLITRERIRVKSQLEPVRPSLLYWIKYYRDELGIGHHDSVQRGDFLFRSENGKRLSPEEREHVNLVLKSVEENMPLEIDTERSEIIFPHFEAPRPVAPAREFAPLPRAISPSRRPLLCHRWRRSGRPRPTRLWHLVDKR